MHYSWDPSGSNKKIMLQELVFTHMSLMHINTGAYCTQQTAGNRFISSSSVNALLKLFIFCQKRVMTK